MLEGKVKSNKLAFRALLSKCTNVSPGSQFTSQEPVWGRAGRGEVCDHAHLMVLDEGP